MITKMITTDYWFTIEPYVYLGITDCKVLLYNTLDGVSIETETFEVIELLQELLQKENCGVVLLTEERYNRKVINSFIGELRDKFMGDIIGVSLSKGKPVQLLPLYNFPDKFDIYKKQSFSPDKNILEHLSEISIHVDSTTNLTKLISFLQSIPGKPIFNIVGNILEIENYGDLLAFFDQHDSPKNILCPYTHVAHLPPSFENNFVYKISVDFPIDLQQWHKSKQVLLHQTLPVVYIFNISSDEDYQQTVQMIDQFHIEEYQLNPIYTGGNIKFFEENVFLDKEDILSTPMSVKDFFSRQSVNIYDFGKINIMPNGDTYANVNHPLLGNIYIHNIYEIIHKELSEGKSWFRIRDQAPCNKCVYQWLCPSPSNYEIAIGQPNLCHVWKEDKKREDR